MLHLPICAALAPGPAMLALRCAVCRACEPSQDLTNQRFFPLFGDTGQDLVTGLGNEHVVLDPYAAPTGQINSRLDRHDHARFELEGLVGCQSRRLMDLQPDSMS